MAKQLNEKAEESGRSVLSGVMAIPSKMKGTVKRLIGIIGDEERITDYVKSEQPSSTLTQSGISKVLRRIAHSPSYSPSCSTRAPYGFFHGRPVIGDSAPIVGGIYLTAEGEEAIVVDDKYGVLHGLYAEFKELYLSKLESTKVTEEQLLQQVLSAIKNIFQWDKLKVRGVNTKHGIQVDQKVALDIYISAGFGVARHHVLTAAYILERLKQEGRLTGTISIDTAISDERLMYTSTLGDLYMVDFSKSLVDIGH